MEVVPSDSIEWRIYKILTGKKFRAGPLPLEDSRMLILEKIKKKTGENLPIRLLQFWGGCKNPNLTKDGADLCESATFDQLERLNRKVVEIYKPGLEIIICPGDARVQRANKIPKEKTEVYVRSLTDCAKKYGGLFSVVPLSKLYVNYFNELTERFDLVKRKIGEDVFCREDFKILAANASKNIFRSDLKSEHEILDRGREAAGDYVFWRVAEEETYIFKDYDDCIRSFLIRYAPFYKKYIADMAKTKPRLDCQLVFYTGWKGNITQPWQAVGVIKEGSLRFLSQNRSL